MTVRDAATAWLSAYQDIYKPRTWSDHAANLHRRIVPLIGDKQLRRVTATDIERVLAAVKGSRQRQKVYRTLSRLFAYAAEMGWTLVNPLHGLPAPRHRYRRPALPSLDGLRQLYQHVLARDDVAANFTGLLLLTGLRPGEAAALRWSDLDAERRLLWVRRAGAYIDGAWREGPPKSAASERIVPLNDDALALLERQRRHVARLRERAGERWKERDLAFPGGRGAPVHRSVMHKWVRRVCKDAGIPSLRPHDLRHAHASLLIAAGAPLSDVSGRLGHARANVTLALYSHVLRPGSELAALATAALAGRAAE